MNPPTMRLSRPGNTLSGPRLKATSDIKQISKEVFSDVVAEYLPMSIHEELGKSNSSIRQSYLRRVMSGPHPLLTAINTKDLELLDIIKNEDHREQVEDVIYDALESTPEFVHYILGYASEDEIFDIVQSFSEDDGNFSLTKNILLYPKILDFFIPYIDNMEGIVSINEQERSMEFFTLLVDKIGYIPRKLFAHYMGTIVESLNSDDTQTMLEKGEMLLALVSTSNNALSDAMKFYSKVK